MRAKRTVGAPPGGAERISPVYRAVMAGAWPVVRGSGRLETTGADHLPTGGATIVVANHDSAWDPVVIAVAVRRRRQIRALAKVSLWRHPVRARVLDAMGQIPVER